MSAFKQYMDASAKVCGVSISRWTLVTILLCVMAMNALGGCTSTERVLSGVDYACVDVSVDGPWTDSGIAGRGIVLPEGETLTAETIDDLCNY